MGTFYDTMNNSGGGSPSPVSEWPSIQFVIDFRRKPGDSSKIPPHFGFDWTDINKDGKITKHHDIPVSEVEYVINDYSTIFSKYKLGDHKEMLEAFYVKIDGTNAEMIEKAYQSMFVFHSITCKDTSKLYTTNAYLSLPNYDTSVELIMKIREDETDPDRKYPSKIYFKVPQGFKIEVGTEGKLFHDFTRDIEFEVKSNADIPIKITNYAKVLRMEPIIVYNNKSDKDYKTIGELYVLVNRKKEYPIKLWNLINSNACKKTSDFEKAKNNLSLSATEITNLNQKLKEVFNQIGVDIKLDNAVGVLSYDESKLKEYIPSNKIKANSGFDFFNVIVDDFERSIEKNNKEPILVVKEGDLPQELTSSYLFIPDMEIMGKSDGTMLGGAGIINRYGIIIFKNNMKNFGVYAHEIAHTLGALHTFYEDDIIDLSNLSNNFEQMMIRKYKFIINNIDKKQDLDDAFKSYLDTHADEKKNYDDIKAREAERGKKTDLDVNEKEQEEKDNSEKGDIYFRFYQWNEAKGNPAIYDTDADIKTISNNFTTLLDSIPPVLYRQSKANNAVMDYGADYVDFFIWEWIKMGYIYRTRLSDAK